MTTIIRKFLRHNAKHKKLSEEWALAECEGSEGWWQNTNEECKTAMYAGTAPAQRAASGPATAKAVKVALQTAKSNRQKMRKVNLTITSKGLIAADFETSEKLLRLSIYSISFCTVDSANARVFAVVEGGDDDNREHFTAHVFVCEKRRHAKAFALSLAHAFNDAYQEYQTNKKKSSKEKTTPSWVSFPDEFGEENQIETWRSSTPKLLNF